MGNKRAIGAATATSAADGSPLAAWEAEVSEARRRAEIAERRYAALARLTGDWAWTTTAQGEVECDIPAGREFTGQATKVVLGRGLADAIHPDDREGSIAAWTHAVATRTPYAHAHRVRRTDNTYRTMLIRGTPVLDDAGHVLEWVCLTKDVTEQVEREGELEAIQALTDAALFHLDLDTLLDALLGRIRAIMSVDNAAVLLVSPEGRDLALRAVQGPEAEVADRVRVPIGEGFAGRIAASGMPLIVEDSAAFDVVTPLLRERLHSLAGVPLSVDGRVLGVLHVGTRKLRRFGERDLDLLQRAADRVALAVDRAQAHALAEARAQELETTLEAMPEAVAIYDAQGRLAHANSMLRNLLSLGGAPEYGELSPEERARRTKLRYPDGSPVSPEELGVARLLRGEVQTSANPWEVALTTLDGREVSLSVTGAPLRDDAGHITGAVATLRDVTEPRRLEQRVRETLDALLAMAEAMVSDAGTDQEIVASSSSGAEELRGDSSQALSIICRLAELTRGLLGCSRVSVTALDGDDLVSRPVAIVGLTPAQEAQWWDEQRAMPRRPLREGLLPPELERILAGEAATFDLTRPPYQFENPYGVTAILGAPMQVEGRLVGLLALDYESAEGAIHAFTPEEERVALAVAQLCALVLERDRLHREHEAARLRELALAEANRQMDEFLGIASHELRTPLTSVTANVQIVSRQLRGLTRTLEADGADIQGEPTATGETRTRLERSDQLLERAGRQLKRLDRLVGDLLDTSRIQAGKLELRPERCDLAEIAREAIAEQRASSPARELALDQFGRDGLSIHADPDRVGQVVTNFLTNALKYSAQDRPVAVRLRKRGDQARLEVVDQGPGLTAEQQQRVFERFYRAPGVEQQAGSGIGLGLGLYICATIIERHGGSLGVESTSGKGSSFWFELPLTRDGA